MGGGSNNQLFLGAVGLGEGTQPPDPYPQQIRGSSYELPPKPLGGHVSILQRPESGPRDWDPSYSCPLTGETESLLLYRVLLGQDGASRLCIHRLSAMVGQWVKVTSQPQI